MNLWWISNHFGNLFEKLLVFLVNSPFHRHCPKMYILSFNISFLKTFVIFKDVGFTITRSIFILCSSDIKHFLLLFSRWSMSDSSWPHETVACRLLCPGDFPRKTTGVSCHLLLQGIFPTQELNPWLLPRLLHCRQILYHRATWEAQAFPR